MSGLTTVSPVATNGQLVWIATGPVVRTRISSDWSSRGFQRIVRCAMLTLTWDNSRAKKASWPVRDAIRWRTGNGSASITIATHPSSWMACTWGSPAKDATPRSNIMSARSFAIGRCRLPVPVAMVEVRQMPDLRGGSREKFPIWNWIG